MTALRRPRTPEQDAIAELHVAQQQLSNAQQHIDTALALLDGTTPVPPDPQPPTDVVRQINFNVIGEPEHEVVGLLDLDPGRYAVVVDATRATLDLSPAPVSVEGTGGGVWHGETEIQRFIVPPPGYYEADLPPVRPPEQVGDVVLVFGPTRPPAILQPPLPPWDQSVHGEGDVHTTPPPEWSAIDKAHDPLFMTADFAGCNLSQSRWGVPPMLAGANSTPITMLMTPMLPMYPRYWQDACLTEHAERGYRHFVISSGGPAGRDWNFAANGYYPSPQQVADWAAYVTSWGFEVVHWGAFRMDCPYLREMLNRSVIAWHLIGGETDEVVRTCEEFDVMIRNNLAMTGGLPTACHFTPNWPEGWPRDTYVTNWGDFDGKLHLLWQAAQQEGAGKQGARLYYARERVNLGKWGGQSAAPHSVVIAFETMATEQLYGRCDEAYGCLRDLELNYCTRADDRVLPVYGAGNGIRYADGSPIVP